MGKGLRPIAIAVATLALGAAAFVVSRREPATPPFVVWVEASDEHELEQKLQRVGFQLSVDEKAEERATSLALSVLSERRAKDLAEQLQKLALLSPTTPSADTELQGVVEMFAPIRFEARATATHLHYTKARNGAAAVSVACPVSSDAHCASLWDLDSDESVARAKQLVGPIADAAVLETEDEASGDVLVRRLTSATPKHLAFAFTARTLASPTTSSEREIQSFARLSTKFLNGKGTREQRELLDLLAQPTIPSAPWLKLAPNRVVVVPRVSSRALLPAFVAELTGLLGSDAVRWVRTPVKP